MSHYAKVENGIVTQVIVAEEDFIQTGALGDPAGWIQTSYNTRGGEHPEGRPLRKNYAGIGYTYDSQRDAFIPPQPYPSWTLNEDTCLWEPPVPMPVDEYFYTWNQETTSWVQGDLRPVVEAVVEAPVEAVVETPVEAVVETPVDPVVEALVETPAENNT